MSERLRTAVVGLRIGENHLASLSSLPDTYEVVAVCDIDEQRARDVAGKYSVPNVYTNYTDLLAAERLDVVVVASPTSLHAPMTIDAAKKGVRGICCEKPIAVHPREAREMMRVCAEMRVPLIINHQRRVGTDLLAARALIDSGAIGTVRWIRGICAGDLLSDGTHLVDSLLWLAGDSDPVWAIGQMHREVPAEEVGGPKSNAFATRAGYRFGHPVESGGTALVELANGIRLEFLTGDLMELGRIYQDYEVFGMTGRLWRTDDTNNPNLFISDKDGGSWDAKLNENWRYKPMPNADNAHGLWRPVETPDCDPIAESYRRFANTIETGAPHPMDIDHAWRGFEIITAIYESVRLRTRVSFPVQQDTFPLQLMLEESQ